MLSRKGRVNMKAFIVGLHLLEINSPTPKFEPFRAYMKPLIFFFSFSTTCLQIAQKVAGLHVKLKRNKSM